MLEEFIPYICWMDFDYTVPEHMKLWRDLNIKGMRAFFNTDDIPYSAVMPTQNYMQKCFDTMPNPMHAWTYEDNPLPWLQKGMMRDIFNVCKSEKWLPIISFGCQEETPHGWLGRAISEDKWPWLTEFVRQLGIYLRDKMGFSRVDFEWWNEPTKLQSLNWGYDKYCALGTKLAIVWHTVSNSNKFYAFSDDLQNMYYLKLILTDEVFCPNIDVISTHIGVGTEDSEWNNKLITECNKLIAVYSHLKQSVSELTCNGIITRLDQLKNGTTVGYGHIGLNRHLVNGNLLGTRMDDYANWDTNYFKITAQDKINVSAQFNKENYKVGEEDMNLDKIYKDGSTGIGVRFIQKVLNADIKPTVPLAVDGVWSPKMDAIVLVYQKKYGLSQYAGDIGPNTMQQMIDLYPKIWNNIEYLWSIGIR